MAGIHRYPNELEYAAYSMFAHIIAHSLYDVITRWLDVREGKEGTEGCSRQ